MAKPKRKKKRDVSGGTDYPSGRPGGSENVWNFQQSYEPSATVPSMRGPLSKFTGKNIHK